MDFMNQKTSTTADDRGTQTTQIEGHFFPALLFL